ncbi:uncharacterized protein LOC110838449 [Zootermopsis nevadensis]|uniref:Uncharacterized protein n=1 Tax=Zootermopsis nevadensis TaxID=136037 RepID=A0A067QVE5_ZOONE|nr:uncharacterized protein LOC110838449 [Zootermopsis nevadensis]KDR09841.1 hypothetical protein L798_00536 [Zootermopsis nevadensis]
MFTMEKLFYTALVCGFVICSALPNGKRSFSDLVEMEAGSEEMNSYSSLINGESLHNEHGDTKLSRVARWTEQNNIECCNRDKQKLSNKDGEIMAQCLIETKSKNSSQEYSLKQIVCLVDCAVKKSDLVDGDGNLDAEKVIPYVKAREGYGQLFANKDDLIKRCVDFANSFSKERGEVNFEDQKCNIASAVIGDCIKYMVEISCPDDRKVAGEQCDNVRKRISELVDVLNI